MFRLPMLFLCLFLCCLTSLAEYEKGELLYQCEFKTIDSLKDWQPSLAVFEPNGGPDGKGAIKLSSNQLISHELAPEKFTGLVLFEITYKGKDIKEAEKPYFGAKNMLVIEGAKTSWSEPVDMQRRGTFDWQTVQKIDMIKPDTKKLKLCLGIEKTSGEYWCERVSIYRAIKKPLAVEKNTEPLISKENWKGGSYRGFMSGNDMSEAAFQTLAVWNANLIRYQIHPKGQDVSTPEKYLEWIKNEIPKIDGILLLCEKYKIKMVLDLHCGPPGSKRNEVSSNIISDTDAILRQLKDVWKILAEHYKGNQWIYGYDLLNEPKCEDYSKTEKDPWKRISTELVNYIREIDAETPIIVEPDLSDVRKLHYIDVKNIIYSIHAYAPIYYTHQGVMSNHAIEWSYPGKMQGKEWNREELRKDLQSVRDFQLQHNVPIFVGEFSTIAWAPGRAEYLADLIDIFEEFGWDWTYHAFREWPGWSLEYTADAPNKLKHNPDNSALKTVQEVLKKNKQPQKKSWIVRFLF